MKIFSPSQKVVQVVFDRSNDQFLASSADEIARVKYAAVGTV